MLEITLPAVERAAPNDRWPDAIEGEFSISGYLEIGCFEKSIPIGARSQPEIVFDQTFFLQKARILSPLDRGDVSDAKLP